MNNLRLSLVLFIANVQGHTKLNYRLGEWYLGAPFKEHNQSTK